MPEPLLEAFPQQPDPKYDLGLLRKLLNFFALLALAGCVIIELSFTRGASWIFFAIAGIISVWITVSVALRFRTQIFKNLTHLMILLTILSFIWDHFTGAYGWSVDFALPLGCEITMLLDLSLIWILHTDESEYLIHLIIVSLYSLLPFVFLILNMTTIPIPSVICTLTAFCIIVSLVILRG